VGMPRKPILILGLGNPLRGDDGVGCQVAEVLARQTLPPDVEVMDGGTPGVGLLHILEGRRRVILVDAAEMGRAPGSVARFRPGETRLGESAEGFSLHHSGVAEALALAEALRLDLPELLVFGVQPAHVGWDQALSRPVQAAVANVVEAVTQEAGREPLTGADHGTREALDH
jgi:hydrogenase maturation protease